MALIIPEVKHEYIFMEDSEQDKEIQFDQCRADNKDCPEDVKSAKQNKISAIVTLSSGIVGVITWLIYNIINW